MQWKEVKEDFNHGWTRIRTRNSPSRGRGIRGCFGLAEKPSRFVRAGHRAGKGRADGRTGHGFFGQRGATAGAEEFMQLARWQNEKQPFADGLRPTTLRTEQLAGGEGSKLLAHIRNYSVAMT